MPTKLKSADGKEVVINENWGDIPEEKRAKLIAKGYNPDHASVVAANEAMSKKATEATVSPIEALGRGFSQGGSFGFADELQENPTSERARLAEVKSARPGLTTLGEIVGSTVATLPTAALRIPSLLGRIGAGAATGAATGALSGAGGAENGDRLQGAAIGGGVGGVIGGTVPAAITGAANAASGFGQAAARLLAGVPRSAVERRLDRPVMNAPGLADEARRLAQGVGEAQQLKDWGSQTAEGLLQGNIPAADIRAAMQNAGSRGIETQNPALIALSNRMNQQAADLTQNGDVPAQIVNTLRKQANTAGRVAPGTPATPEQIANRRLASDLVPLLRQNPDYAEVQGSVADLSGRMNRAIPRSAENARSEPARMIPLLKSMQNPENARGQLAAEALQNLPEVGANFVENARDLGARDAFQKPLEPGFLGLTGAVRSIARPATGVALDAARGLRVLTNPGSRFGSVLMRALAQGPAAFEAAHNQLLNDPEYVAELNATP